MSILSSDRAIYIHISNLREYIKEVPFDPPESYPELDFISRTNKANKIYAAVRDLLKMMCLDKDNIGTPRWNPFGDFIKPGDKVLIKPNLVTDYHYLGKKAVLSTIVHGSIIRPILDYSYLALRGSGKITIGDNPVESADFDRIMAITQVKKMINELQQYGYKNLEVVDFRPFISTERNNGVSLNNAAADKVKSIKVDLGKASALSEFDSDPHVHYYTLADSTVDHLDPNERSSSITDRYHNSKVHEYVVSKAALESNVVISIAKMKTHCKAGISLSLKNMLGIIGTKNCMPHHRPGSPPEGDAFPAYPASYYVSSRRLYSALMRSIRIHKAPGLKSLIGFLRRKKLIVGQQIEHGDWKGNDTLWRTILDTVRIAIYADKQGNMCSTPQRRFMWFVDGIIGQHENAPISGTPKPCGILIGGCNPVTIDALACKIMGIDYRLIKSITEAPKLRKWPLLTEDVDLSFPDIETPNLQFILPKGWR